MHLRIAFGTQTNTILPVLAYLLEVSEDNIQDIILINSQHLVDQESREKSELAIMELVKAIHPRAHCEIFNTNLPLITRSTHSYFLRIKAIREYKKFFFKEINTIGIRFAAGPSRKVTWVSDVGIHGLLAFGLPVIPGELIFVPHEMRHFNDYSAHAHRMAWGVPGVPGWLTRWFNSFSSWVKYKVVGCGYPPFFWPFICRVKHFTYNQILSWHPNCLLLSDVHSVDWYASHFNIDVSCYDNTDEIRVLLILSQLHGDERALYLDILNAMTKGDIEKDFVIHVKTHPQEIGKWNSVCDNVESITGCAVFRDPRINYFPSELWLSKVRYNLVLGYSSGAMAVASELYHIPVINLGGPRA